MRKKTQLHLFDNIFWYVIYLAPLIIAIFGMVNTAGSFIADVGFENFYNNYGWIDLYSGQLMGILESLGFSTQSLLVETFNQLFAHGGILPLCDMYNAIFCYMNYFITMMIIHLAVDFILFIPRLAHKFMNKFTQGD